MPVCTCLRIAFMRLSNLSMRASRLGHARLGLGHSFIELGHPFLGFGLHLQDEFNGSLYVHLRSKYKTAAGHVAAKAYNSVDEPARIAPRTAALAPCPLQYFRRSRRALAGCGGARRARIAHALAAGLARILPALRAGGLVALRAFSRRRRILHLAQASLRRLARIPVRLALLRQQHPLLPDAAAFRRRHCQLHVRPERHPILGESRVRDPAHARRAMARFRSQPAGTALPEMARADWRRTYIPGGSAALTVPFAGPG